MLRRRWRELIGRAGSAKESLQGNVLQQAIEGEKKERKERETKSLQMLWAVANEGMNKSCSISGGRWHSMWEVGYFKRTNCVSQTWGVVTKVFRTLDESGQKRIIGLKEGFPTSQELEFSEIDDRIYHFPNCGICREKCVRVKLGFMGLGWIRAEHESC